MTVIRAEEHAEGEEGTNRKCTRSRGGGFFGSPDRLRLPLIGRLGADGGGMGGCAPPTPLTSLTGGPFSPAAGEAAVTAVIAVYVKTCRADFTPEAFRRRDCRDVARHGRCSRRTLSGALQDAKTLESQVIYKQFWKVDNFTLKTFTRCT